MMLYVNGEDIDNLVLGLVEKSDDVFSFIKAPENFSASNELFLKTILGYLEQEGIEPSKLEGIIVASGDGSSTALRTTHALSNVWSFVHGVPLFPVLKKKDADDADVLSAVNAEPLSFIRPAYERAPHITASKKDALRR